ncbi:MULTISPECIES: glycosyltransferase [Staphylococcus]|uniref:glycosyltransferase n=1 Tax=Staphylococcus TaxID=1279 RepID=UPI00094B9FD0|nr:MULTISPECIES: glycosyltransferase [Staphylococcus]MDW4582596.1 glycosyltransferase [Staphylococcus saprophyticus]MEB5645552.1 glycosyltransferase [Staphylococcus saprophyticus]OLN93836.1 glycosyl transferase [Staphylococcus saprophyticus]
MKNDEFSLDSIEFNEQRKTDKYNYILSEIDDKYNYAIELLERTINKKNVFDYYYQVEKNSKLNFINSNFERLKSSIESNGSTIFKKTNLNVGIIADVFLYNSFKDVCKLHYISSENHEINEKLDFIIIASTWKGIDNSWSGFANPASNKREILYDLINDYKSAGIPVIFYSKEDPVNYDIFKDIARVCDIIFTSAEEMIEKYIEYCRNENVFPLQFGVNPHYHNPVGSRLGENKSVKENVIFAGSWTKKYPERNNDLHRILKGTIQSEKDLTIIDRNLDLKSDRYQFPIEMIPYLAPPVSHDILMKLHKIYRWAINVNSVKYSNSMFANRVFELQGFGNMLLSNYSIGMNNQFSNVFIINVEEDVNLILNNYSEKYLKDLQAKSIRNAMRNNTTYHRLDEIIKRLNIKVIQKEPKILVLAKKITEKIQESFNRQLNVNATLKAYDDPLFIYEYDFIAYMNNEYIYEEYYLEDLLAAFKYTNVDFVTKNNNKKVHNYTTVFDDRFKTMYKATMLKENLELMKCSIGYVLDETEIFTTQYCNVSDPELSVIIPIYNNGEYLEEKCFKSLLRSSIFKKMELIFVNDGSDDIKTRHVIKRLIRRYPNIKSFDFDNGSGSASRPRNKGIELATTKYITYLDPDNEATGDGYKRLFEKMKQDNSLDMIVGNIIKEDNETRKQLRFSGTVKKYNNNKELIENTKKFLKDSGLRTQSIQAAIIKKEVIKKNNLKMIEGAAGQDSLFFNELMLASKKCLSVDDYIHVYYAAVTGSVTNSESKSLFDKYLKLEGIRVPFLIKNGLMTAYMENRFNFYFKNWYLPRLKKVKQSEYKDAVKLFLKIYKMYEEFERPTDRELENEVQRLMEEIK